MTVGGLNNGVTTAAGSESMAIGALKKANQAQETQMASLLNGMEQTTAKAQAAAPAPGGLNIKA